MFDVYLLFTILGLQAVKLFIYVSKMMFAPTHWLVSDKSLKDPKIFYKKNCRGKNALPLSLITLPQY